MLAEMPHFKMVNGFHSFCGKTHGNFYLDTTILYFSEKANSSQLEKIIQELMQEKFSKSEFESLIGGGYLNTQDGARKYPLIKFSDPCITNASDISTSIVSDILENNSCIPGSELSIFVIYNNPKMISKKHNYKAPPISESLTMPEIRQELPDFVNGSMRTVIDYCRKEIKQGCCATCGKSPI